MLVGVACFACGTSPAQESKTPARMIVVPADRVVEKCPCGGDEDEAAMPARKATEYVHVGEWHSPPSARRAEAEIAKSPRGTIGESGYVELPRLTLHQGIPEGRVHRMGRGYGWR